NFNRKPGTLKGRYNLPGFRARLWPSEPRTPLLTGHWRGGSVWSALGWGRWGRSGSQLFPGSGGVSPSVVSALGEARHAWAAVAVTLPRHPMLRMSQCCHLSRRSHRHATYQSAFLISLSDLVVQHSQHPL
uniref:Uncharacterized protein n=1 Tax=Xiphophorus maculatus TaxID=8083 RepID=A0A3B5PYI9_XIPMA